MLEETRSVDRIRAALSARRPLSVEGERHAAVAAVLRHGGSDLEVLLIRRAEHPEDPWSGHMAFPGGRREPADASLLETAHREVREEVGLDLAGGAELLGRLDDLPAIGRGGPTGLVIAPFVFVAVGDHVLRPNHEVAEALWAPMGPMRSGAVATIHPVRHEGTQYEMPAYDLAGRVVWGLTYRMLTTILNLIP